MLISGLFILQLFIIEKKNYTITTQKKEILPVSDRLESDK